MWSTLIHSYVTDKNLLNEHELRLYREKDGYNGEHFPEVLATVRKWYAVQ